MKTIANVIRGQWSCSEAQSIRLGAIQAQYDTLIIPDHPEFIELVEQFIPRRLFHIHTKEEWVGFMCITCVEFASLCALLCEKCDKRKISFFANFGTLKKVFFFLFNKRLICLPRNKKPPT